MDLNFDYTGKRIGKYILLEKKGRGNFGAVYRARDTVLNTETGLKLLRVSDPEEARKLFREAEIPHRCRHDNIVKVNGGDCFRGDAGIIFAIDMELVDGGTVERALEEKRISVADSLEIVRDVLFGLEHAHNNGVIHRDIKPANILLHKGTPKLSDFGLATALNSLVTGEWYKPHLAPEAKGSVVATVGMDIFALGITMYRMVNGIQDWRSFFPRYYRNGMLNVNELPFEPYISKKVIRIIKKAWNPEPSKRYSSAAEMRNAMTKLRIDLNWRQVGDSHWEGTARGVRREAFVEKGCKSYKVVSKRNGRRVSNECHEFHSQEESSACLCDFISDTMIG